MESRHPFFGSLKLERWEAAIAAGWDVNTVWRGHGVTLLMVAAGRGLIPLVRLLLNHGADVNRISARGITALMQAVIESRHEITAMILAREPELEVRTWRGATAVDLAVLARNRLGFDALLRAGARAPAA